MASMQYTRAGNKKGQPGTVDLRYLVEAAGIEPAAVTVTLL